MAAPIQAVHHHLARMVGRDPHEDGRVATTLELLYDLTLVVAFGVAGSEFAHSLAAGHIVEGSAAFFFVLFAVCWAWMSSTWFDSAFDTDDWIVRVATMVQMAGVIILTTGIPELFAGFDHGWELRNQTMVLGYVVMRVPLVLLWWRASQDVPSARLRLAARRIAGWIILNQVGWVAIAVLPVPPVPALLLAAVLFAAEIGVPYLLERQAGGTPWHPHHLAERYALLTIIALGEIVVGTAETVRALHAAHGWTPEVMLVLLAGVSLTMGLWWVYFSVPFGDILHRHRDRLFRFSYPHMLLYFSIAGVGAGLHAAAYQIEGESKLGAPGTIVAIALPTAAFIVLVFILITGLTSHRSLERFHLGEILVMLAVLVLGVALTAFGAPLAVGIAVVMLAPWVMVVGYEWQGYRHLNEWIAQDA